MEIYHGCGYMRLSYKTKDGQKYRMVKLSSIRNIKIRNNTLLVVLKDRVLYFHFDEATL